MIVRLIRSVSVLLLAMTFYPIAHAASGNIFIYPHAPPNELPERAQNVLAHAKRSNPASRDSQLMKIRMGAITKATTSISFNLVSGEAFVFSVERTRQADNGFFSWSGTAEGTDGRALLSVGQGMVRGRFNVGERYFEIVPLDAQWHALIALDMSAYPAYENDQVCEDCEAGEVVENGMTALLQNTVINVLVAYTDAVKGSNTKTQMLLKAQSFIDRANDALNNAQVYGITFSLDRALPVNYVEGANTFSDHLDALRNTADGIMDEVHTIRNWDAADMVALLVESSGSCGIAYINSASTTAFSVTDHGCLNNESFTHELMHNFGARHDVDHDPTTTPYAYGHGYEDPGSAFRTVMAYDCQEQCGRITYLSNPDVFYASKVTGTAAESDVARVAAVRANTVAGFRTAEADSSPALQSEDKCFGLNYMIWSNVSGATRYQLFRSDVSWMASPILVYEGATTSKKVLYRSDGHNFYAVKACAGDEVCGDFSNSAYAAYTTNCP